MKNAYAEIIFHYQYESEFNKNMLTHVDPKNYSFLEYNELYDILKKEYKNLKKEEMKKSETQLKDIENNINESRIKSKRKIL